MQICTTAYTRNKTNFRNTGENEDMKIITKKQPKGFRAMSQVLDYQRAIVSILQTLNLKEIEIEDCLLYRTEDKIEVSRTINNTTKIRIRQTGGKR